MDAAGTTVDAPVTGGGADARTGPCDGGCKCALPSSPSPGNAVALLLAAVFVLGVRRRRC
ncbi:MAG TPA: MYXO-CTERM sorting domain-containing protein [Polyangia bacterium]|jgi:MYXO-CTERM domain-containing protein